MNSRATATPPTKSTMVNVSGLYPEAKANRLLSAMLNITGNFVRSRTLFLSNGFLSAQTSRRV